MDERKIRLGFPEGSIKERRPGSKLGKNEVDTTAPTDTKKEDNDLKNARDWAAGDPRFND